MLKAVDTDSICVCDDPNHECCDDIPGFYIEKESIGWKLYHQCCPGSAPLILMLFKTVCNGPENVMG